MRDPPGTYNPSRYRTASPVATGRGRGRRWKPTTFPISPFEEEPPKGPGLVIPPQLQSDLRLMRHGPRSDPTYGKGEPDFELAQRAIDLLQQGVPASEDRPVRMMTVRPHGFYQSGAYTGEYHPIGEDEFRRGLGRLLAVAKDGGWYVYAFRYNWERARQEHTAHFGYLTSEVMIRRPDAVTCQDGRPALLAYHLLGEPVRASLGATFTTR